MAPGGCTTCPGAFVICEKRSPWQKGDDGVLSILDRDPSAGGEEVAEPPYFRDLLLDRVVGAITAGRDAFHLQAYFYRPLGSAPAVLYRQAVFQDLERLPVRTAAERFAAAMAASRQHLAQAEALRDELQQHRWFLEGTLVRGQAIAALARDWAAANLRSAALGSAQAFLNQLAQSPAVQTMQAEAAQLVQDLASVYYDVHIQGSRVAVLPHQGDKDFGAAIEAAFARFRQGPVEPYAFRSQRDPELNHVEAQILHLVAQQHTELFSRLEQFHSTYATLWPPDVAQLDRELQWYLAWREYAESLATAGLPICFPEVHRAPGPMQIREAFHPALLDVMRPPDIVCNSLDITEPECVAVVSGPNQGGKTTFARLFATVHYLGQLGGPIPAAAARLTLFDHIFTHFPREERAGAPSSHLEEELRRMLDILGSATRESLVVLNEPFGSTTAQDARWLGQRVLTRLADIGARTVCVTFLDEWSRLSDATVSLVAVARSARRGEPAERTFRIVRRPADGRAHAVSLAERHGLGYEQVREQLAGGGS